MCTPVGFVHLFEVVGKFLIKPQFLRDIDEEFNSYRLEEENLLRRLSHAQKTNTYITPAPMMFGNIAPVLHDDGNTHAGILRLRNGALQLGLTERLTIIEAKRKLLDKQRQVSSMKRNILYPIAMLLLLALTVGTELIVVQNTLELLIGMKALPLSTRVCFRAVAAVGLVTFLSFLAIYVGHYFVIDARPGRCLFGNLDDHISDSDVVRRVVFVAVRREDPPAAEADAV